MAGCPAVRSAPDTFPRQYARTQRLTLGEPRTIRVSPDGRRVVFCRSAGGSDPVNQLWVLDVESGVERLVADPRVLLATPGGGDDDLPAEERARRERARESAGGVVAYATDADGRVAAFALAGRLFTAGLISAAARELVVDGPVFDPRPDPPARRVAYVCGRELRVAELDGTTRTLASEDDPDISWGTAEFIAAEEMDRSRGYWWAPDGEAIAAARVDITAVRRWYVADLAAPERAPTELAYPAAGTANADVTLHVLGLDGRRVEVAWDRSRFPYLADVAWPDHGLTLVVQSRDQRRTQTLVADPVTGATTVVLEDADDQWVELVAGTPAWLGDGRLVTAADRDGARRVCVDGVPVTPASLQVRAIVDAAADRVVFSASEPDQPAEIHVYRWHAAAPPDAPCERLSVEPGVHSAAAGGDTVVLRSATLDAPRARTAVIGGPELASFAEEPLVHPQVHLRRVGARRLQAALLLPGTTASPTAGTTASTTAGTTASPTAGPTAAPTGADDAPLPVLLDPYGGPHAQRAVAARAAHLTSQWFADQGFAVVVIDGRGTPGRGPEWERAVYRDLAGPVLEDQVDGLHALAADQPRLDLSRVAIRGWSFGGYLAALAVLRRPDVFHAAIAGAPVTEWRLYDSHYTERYLGDPTADPGPYDACSLLPDAGELQRPLLLVHGLADDNVVAAHTLQLSSALLGSGRPHRVLPLSGVTHMTPQEVVAENLLRLQLDFLREALRLEPPQPDG